MVNNIKETKINIINIDNYVDMGDKMLYSISEMSLFAQKLFYTAISTIQSEDKEFKEVVFKASDIGKKFKMQRPNVSSGLYQATSELMESQLLVWDEIMQDFIQISIYDTKIMPKKEGIVILKFSNAMKKYLLELKNHFAKVPLEYLLDFRSQNAMKLFHIFYGHFYTNRKYKRHDKLKISYRQLKAVFEPEVFRTYSRTKKWGKQKYPKFKDFRRNVLDPSIEAINKQGILHIEIDSVRGESDSESTYFFKNSLPINNRKISHLVFTITEGEAFTIRERERENKKIEDSLLREICDYFKARFDIHESVIKNLVKKHTYAELMLSAISMQSVLNLSSRGLWIYNEQQNWRDLTYRKNNYIKEYQKIAIPNLGISFMEDDNKFHQFIIKEPVGFLKKTLEEQWYFKTIDLINTEGYLASFGNDTAEKIYTKSFYDTEYGDEFKILIRNGNKDTDLIYRAFSLCRDGALKMHPNERWTNYFYKNNLLNLYWKLDFYPQYPEQQKAMKARIDRILKSRKLA